MVERSTFRTLDDVSLVRRAYLEPNREISIGPADAPSTAQQRRRR